MLAGVAAPASTMAACRETQPDPAQGVWGIGDLRTFGAKVDRKTDDSDALRAALKTKRAILIEGAARIDQVIDIPYEATIMGTGVHRSRIVLGPSGKLRLSGLSFGSRGSGASIRDLTIEALEHGSDDFAVEFRHLEHSVIDNVTFYRCSVLLDDHHYIKFRDCYFFADPGKSRLSSTCVSQPKGNVAISECPQFSGCFFTAYPVTLEDTVGACFTDCTFFTGSHGIRSIRNFARGTDKEPFFMGPVVSGCMFDSVNGPALDIEGGGTDCRIVNNFFSVGRASNAPGIGLTASSGIEILGNRFEWCGGPGLALNGCEKIGVVCNSFANMAGASAIYAANSREVRVVGNAFENRPRWGGSAEGFTTLAIECGDGRCADWVVSANTASGLRDARVSNLRNSMVQNNIGWPSSTEQGWPSGVSDKRPRDVADGYRWYDTTIGQWIHWHRSSNRWRDPSGRAV